MPSSLTAAIYVANDNYIEVDALANGATDAFENSATVTATLKTSGGAEVAGQSWPLTLNYVADSDGTYRGILDDALSIVAGTTYVVHIEATASGLTAHWEISLQAQTRT